MASSAVTLASRVRLSPRRRAARSLSPGIRGSCRTQSMPTTAPSRHSGEQLTSALCRDPSSRATSRRPAHGFPDRTRCTTADSASCSLSSVKSRVTTSVPTSARSDREALRAASFAKTIWPAPSTSRAGVSKESRSTGSAGQQSGRLTITCVIITGIAASDRTFLMCRCRAWGLGNAPTMAHPPRRGPESRGARDAVGGNRSLLHPPQSTVVTGRRGLVSCPHPHPGGRADASAVGASGEVPVWPPLLVILGYVWRPGDVGLVTQRHGQGRRGLSPWRSPASAVSWTMVRLAFGEASMGGVHGRRVWGGGGRPSHLSLQPELAVQLPRNRQVPRGQLLRIRLHRAQQGLTRRQQPL